MGKVYEESVNKERVVPVAEDNVKDPITELEMRLKKIWEEILEVDEIDINESFFDLGGHSLKAIALEVRIRKELKYDINFENIYKSLTIKNLAQDMLTLNKNDKTKIAKTEISEFYPLSWAQEWVYIIQNNLGNSNFNMPFAVVIDGEIDRHRLKDTFKKLIDRHEVLRTSFDFVGDKPVQRIHDSVDFDLDYVEVDERDLDDVVHGFIMPFDIKAAPLLRVQLIKVKQDKQLLLMDMHHIISDGYSMNILFNELVDLYHGNDLPLLEYTYKDFAVWQNQLIHSKLLEEREKFWLNELAGEIPVLDLPLDYPYSSEQGYVGAAIEFELPREVVKRLDKIAKQRYTTMHNMIFSLYAILLHKYSGQEDIVIGSISAGRQYYGYENVLGMFINTLPVRNRINKNLAFSDFLNATSQHMIEVYKNEEILFGKILNNLQSKKRYSVNALFDTLFIYHSEYQNSKKKRVGNVKFSDYPIKKYDAEMNIQIDAFYDGAEKLVCKLEYHAGKFKKETIENMIRHFINISEAVSNQPDRVIGDINMLSKEETNHIVYDFNQTDRQYDRDILFHQLFERQAEKHPDRKAVISNNQSITYGDLNKKANQLARLLRKEGVQRESIVGILGERSIETVIGVLAVLKAGGAYLPIDTNYPKERIEYLIEDSMPSLILSTKPLEDPFNRPISVIDMSESSLYEDEDTNLDCINKPEDLVYVIYTSGTTGKPKGVMVEHRGLVNIAHAWLKEYKLDKMDVSLLQIASFSFDVFAGDLARIFISGGQMVICQTDILLDFPKLYQLMRQHSISILESTPSLLIPFMDYVNSNELPIDNLKVFIVGSDCCPISEFKKIKARYEDAMRVINSYGVTEVSITSSYYEEAIEKMPMDGNTPIGKPLQNTRFYVLDEGYHVLPIGVVGELYIAGEGVARGYINKPELTKERYFPNPFVPGEIMYKTGDIARWLPDGNIDFLGRKDFQVKIRGYRIELSEIEACIMKYELIRETIVIAKEDRKGEKYLVAFIAANMKIDISELKRHLIKYLNSYMMPAYFVQIDKIPLTPNGKINKKLLNEYDLISETNTEDQKPSNAIEEKLLTIWMEVLDREKIGINESFFDLGGHSLKVVVVAFKIRQMLDVDVPVNVIFEDPTIKGIARYIMEQSIGNKIEENLNVITDIQAGFESDERISESNCSKVEERDLEDEGLVLLKKGEEDMNLFFIHDGTGEVDTYMNICNCVDKKYYCWGVKADKLEGYAPQDYNIEAIANCYIKRLKQIQNGGSYNLVGWSNGGTIVFEMARQLEQSKEKIGFVLLIDSTAPMEQAKEYNSSFDIEVEKKLLQSVTENKVVHSMIINTTTIDELYSTAIKNIDEFSLEKMKKSMPQEIVQSIPSYAKNSLLDYIYYISLVRSLGAARLHYVPKNKIASQLLYIKAAESKELNESKWQDYCIRSTVFTEIDGHHYSIMKYPNVYKITEIINKCIKS